MPMEDIRITPLGEVPDALPLCAQWLNTEWDHEQRYTLDETAKWLREIVGSKAGEAALVASGADRPVGICLLVECDLDQRAELTPWLSSLFVRPDYRRRAIGRRLVRGIETIACEEGAESLFLYTLDRESFYAELGWQTIERLELEAGKFALMSKGL